jgi:sarcosine oxidase
MSNFDVVVIGLGALGSAALHAAARRGLRVVGLEQYDPGHSRSSSYGESRVIRLAYFEHPLYVPLLQEAYRLWNDLEATTGERIMTITGIVEAGYPGAPLVKGSLESSLRHGLPHEQLTAAEVRGRFPAFDLPDDWEAIFQPNAGALFPERAINLFVREATRYGAQVHLRTRVAAVSADGDGVEVVLEDGQRISARSSVVSAGAWITELMPDLVPHLRLTRQPLLWFEPLQKGLTGPERMPIFFFQTPHDLVYGLPDLLGNGVKAASHLDRGPLISAEAPRAEVSAGEAESLRDFLRRYVPAAAGPLNRSSICLYTRSPDEHFIVGPHPRAPQLVIASACSGHGFKFASVMGEILVDLATERGTDRPIDLFAPERLMRA